MTEMTDRAVTDYGRRVSTFILGRSLFENPDIPDSAAIAIREHIDKQLSSLASYFADQGDAFPHVPRLGDLVSLSGQAIASMSASLVREFDALLDIMDRAQDSGEVISAYQNSGDLRSAWGTPLHYVAFARNFSIGGAEGLGAGYEGEQLPFQSG